MWGSGTSSKLNGCWQNSFPYGWMTEVLVFLPAPEGGLKVLATWPSQAIYKVGACFLPGQPERVFQAFSSAPSMKTLHFQRAHLMKSGPPRINSLLPYGGIEPLESSPIIFTSSTPIQMEKGLYPDKGPGVYPGVQFTTLDAWGFQFSLLWLSITCP